MSTYDTDLDDINNICSLVGEIIELTNEIDRNKYNTQFSYIENCKELIKSKAWTIKDKAQKMENRLKIYRGSIEDLGFKRVKKKVK